MVRSRRARLVTALAACAAVIAVLAPAEAAEGPEAVKRPEAVAAKVRCSSTVNVRIADADGGDRLFFSRRRITIRAGSCVRWTWAGVLEHQVRGPGFQSRLRSAPFRYRKRFSRARRAPAQIICGIHPSMRMRVAVTRR